ncbi:type 3 dihydrofolate reductase [Thiothrix nivea]|uniref:Dihydrofolate reductase n=1 Tax=Thiothrix nivea (strain ATCC 35100 / DSM 5205 / JP2) TaxID=870187 RepID=A0A656HEQ0_THINJ|nr:type 3 dihydrofolate reductase [Thiothrix nivea]EIJ33669.1 dihydrofolate reductase [Thiothrix nivea DSM 5205]
MLSLIAAIARNRVIGYEGGMPWHLPADLAWFKRNTLGKPIIMGRKTWDSIGRALPGRRNLVISRDTTFQPTGAERAASPDAALGMVEGVPEAMIVGGAQVYQHFLPHATRLYLTLIDADVLGDTFFPDYNQFQWRELEHHDHPADPNNPYPCTFLVLERES